MAEMTEVVVADARNGIGNAIEECFARFGGAARMLKSSGDAYIKINAVDLKKYSYADPEVLRHVILNLKKGGAKKIYVMENCTQGNFTRLVFKATGILKVCRETGAVPVYLDETGAVPVFLEGTEQFIDVSDFVYDRLIRRKDENLYISLPKLKTHSMSQVTLSIKNQFGFVHQHSRIADHNYRIHQKFADIYRIIRPDFAIVDGLVATNHGHYISEFNAEKCVEKMDVLIAGKDPLAVDVVASDIMGFSVERVEHLRLCRESGIGQGDMGKIKIAGKEVFDARKKNFTSELLDDFPPDVKILRGKDRCCKEGCRRNTETVLEVFYRDHNGKGGFTIMMGKGIDPKEARKLTGPVHIAGGCAIQEWGQEMAERCGKGNITMSRGCNNLSETIQGLCKHMGISPISIVPVNPIESVAMLAKAKLNGTKAKIPPII